MTSSRSLQPLTPVLPSVALAWLMAAFATLLAPQWDRLPLWLLGACAGLAGWRWLVQQGRTRLPGRWLRGAIMLALTSLYAATAQRTGFTVDTAASFFVLAIGLKWLEARDSRDYFVLFFILIYLAAVNFLFRQQIGWTLVNLAGVGMLLVGLQLVNGPATPGAAGRGLRRLGAMLLKVLPVVVVLFLFFPRMAPLWSVPLVSGQARTGISDTMTPGDISSLAQSRERAFRVSFGGELPAHRERYWRGLILDRFDGRTWQQGREPEPRRPGLVARDGGVGDLERNQYDVLMEASGQSWVFALEDSRAVSDNLVAADADLFRLRRPADTSVRYRMALAPAQAPPGAHEELREAGRYLQLPATGNPRARELARTLAAETDSALELVRRILERFRTQAYFYTLRPPPMPEDPVDALLFDEQRGFCAHYASATAFLLRAAGIPARIVVGYQGGSAGADGDYLIVRQYDAHAWVEVWLPAQGWVRADPTAAIAPQRIESGLQDAMAGEGSFLEDSWTAPERYGDVAAIQWASLQLDRINYQWQRWVVGYQGQSQLDLMSRLPGQPGLRELGYLTAALMAMVLLVAGLWAVYRQRAGLRRDPWQQLAGRWQRILQRQGLGAGAASTPDQLAALTARHHPALAGEARTFARTLNNHYYGDPQTHAPATERRQRAWSRRLLRRIRRAPGPEPSSPQESRR